MELTRLMSAAEAVLFASGEPMPLDRLAEALEIGSGDLMKVLLTLGDRLEQESAGLELVMLGDSCQLCTRSEHEAVVRKALEMRRSQPLSQAAMEVLAIIAYNQPVTRGYIEQVRGVDSSSVVVSLEQKGLVEERGRMELPGRPISYGTTANFLRCFGLRSLQDLPPLPTDSAVEEPEQERVLTTPAS